jgi:uncharacterized metal-binding protein
MPKLPSKKVGIVACSGEELAEGTVTRQAALRVLEELRPESTVTICLPLFLAGGEGDRAFARFYPTLAVDGCERRCAARATEELSGRPAAEVVVTDLAAQAGLDRVEGRRCLNEAGLAAVGVVADKVARQVDELLKLHWNRNTGEPADEGPSAPQPSGSERTCACAAGVSPQEVYVNGERVALVALPLLLERFRAAGRLPGRDCARDLLTEVAVYNDLPDQAEEAYLDALERAYAAFLVERKE